MKKLLRTFGVAALIGTAPLAAQAPGEDSAIVDLSCNRACLLAALGNYMGALRAGNVHLVNAAQDVQYTENNVIIPLGTGLWKTIDTADKVGLEVADPYTGNAAWFGSLIENGQPAIYAVRIHVTEGKIDEVESVVHRKTALPAPFGNTDNMVHDPDFNAILPKDQQRPRERLQRIADSYFNTVELNDGQVLAPFDEDCGRLENGISTTTRAKDGASGFILVDGCENQFKLGIYRINKRIRERQYPIIDTERGVVVASGFFDHANEFDRYLLTDGREMKTALKWPNSITLLEAFRIRGEGDSKISRIEAVFTYVPHFMHNPWAGAGSVWPKSKADPKACASDCLTTMSGSVMDAYVSRGWGSLNWADKVGYSENSVGIRVGESIWMTVDAKTDDPLVLTDPELGRSVWVGGIEEHGQPSWAVVTTHANGAKIGGVEALIRRSEYGQPFAAPGAGPKFPVLKQGDRTSRADMLASIDSFYNVLHKVDGSVPADLSSACHWGVNGLDLGDCSAPFKGEFLKTIERVRDRSVLAVDEVRGVVALSAYEDFPASPQQHTTSSGAVVKDSAHYPRTQQVVELFHYRKGVIERIEAFTSELPYGMKPLR